METQISPVNRWLQSKFETWRCQQGVRKTLTEFAAFVGIAEDSMLSFIDGSDIPKGTNLAKLGATLGFEIFELVGIQPSSILDSMPHFFKIRYALAFTEYFETITAQGISRDSLEANQILEEMFKKYYLVKAFTRYPFA